MSERGERGAGRIQRGPQSGKGSPRFARYDVVRYVPVGEPAGGRRGQRPFRRGERPAIPARPTGDEGDAACAARPGIGAIAAGVVSAIVRAALMAVRQ